MNRNQLEHVGARLAARHARNKARQERDEDVSTTRNVALATTGIALVVGLLIIAL